MPDNIVQREESDVMRGQQGVIAGRTNKVRRQQAVEWQTGGRTLHGKRRDNSSSMQKDRGIYTHAMIKL